MKKTSNTFINDQELHIGIKFQWRWLDWPSWFIYKPVNKSVSSSEFLVDSWALSSACSQSRTIVNISTMSEVSDIHRSSRIRPLELNAASEDTVDTETLSTSRAKCDKIGKVSEFSVHHLSTSKLVLDLCTQFVFKYFSSPLLCEVELPLWLDDWAVVALLCILAIWANVLFTTDSSIIG